MGIGIVLKELIDLKGTNVNELSSKIGVTSSTIYSIIKRDNMKVDFDILLKIADELNVDVNYFYEKHKSSKENLFTLTEELLIKKYRILDDYGKKNVDSVLDNEYKRCSDIAVAVAAFGGNGVEFDTLTSEEVRKANEVHARLVREIKGKK